MFSQGVFWLLLLIFSMVVIFPLIFTGFAKNYKVNNKKTFSDDMERGMQTFFSKDYKTALEIFMRLAKSEYAEAQHILSTMYKAGTGVNQDYQEALPLPPFDG